MRAKFYIFPISDNDYYNSRIVGWGACDVSDYNYYMESKYRYTLVENVLKVHPEAEFVERQFDPFGYDERHY